MKKEEYAMTFGQWLNNVKKENVILTVAGELSWEEPRKDEVMQRWHDIWMDQRKQYRLQEKNEQITHALEAIKAKGFQAILKNYDNGHIMARSRSGKLMSYYATTGTITGYWGTAIEGLDEFIRLLGEI